jgi:hypothetical protein
MDTENASNPSPWVAGFQQHVALRVLRRGQVHVLSHNGSAYWLNKEPQMLSHSAP